MVPFSLSKVIGDTNTDYVSESVAAISSRDFVEVSVSAGSLVIGGEDTGEQSSTISAGSSVAVKLRSASAYGRTVYSILTVGDESAVFTVTSDIGNSKVFDKTNKNTVLNFLGTQQFVGDDAWTPGGSPTLHRLEGLAWREALDLTVEPALGFAEKDYGFIADETHGVVYRVSMGDMVLEQRIGLDRPVSIGKAAIQPSSEDPSAFHFYVALRDGRIVHLDPYDQYTPNVVVDVGGTVEDMVTDEANNVLYVSVYDTGEIAEITVDQVTGAVTVEKYAVGLGPARLLLSGSELFCSLHLEDSVAVFDTETRMAEKREVGKRPYGLALNGASVFCVCSGSDDVYSTDAQGTSKVADLPASVPALIYASGSGFFVTYIEGRKIIEHDGDFNTVAQFSASCPLAFLETADSNYLFVGVPNAHTRLAPVDYTPLEFEFSPILGRDRNLLVQSESYTVQGVNDYVYASVDPSGASLVVNGSDAGQEAMVESGDTVAISLVTSSNYGDIEYITASLGASTTQFVVSTLDQDIIPDSIEFYPIKDGNAQTEYTSNTVTISGMKDGTTIPVYVENAMVLINGELASSGDVQNGDTVALVLTSGAAGSLSTGVLRAGPIEAAFRILVPTGNDPLSMSYDAVTDAPLGEPVRTNRYSSNFPVSVTISVPDVYGAKLYINEEEAPLGASIQPGDTFQIEITTVSAYSIRHLVPVRMNDDIFTWEVTTEPDVTPYLIEFPSSRNGDANEEMLSEVRTIDGLGEGVVATAEIAPECRVLVNGVEMNVKDNYAEDEVFSFEVQNGDTVQIAGRAGSPFGTGRTHYLSIGRMTASYTAYSRPVDGAVEDPKNLYLVDVPITGIKQGIGSAAEPVSLTGSEARGKSSHVTAQTLNVEHVSVKSLLLDRPGAEARVFHTEGFDMPGVERYAHQRDLFDAPGIERYPNSKDVFDAPGIERYPNSKDVFDAPGVERYPNSMDTFDRPSVERRSNSMDTFDRPEVDLVRTRRIGLAQPAADVTLIKRVFKEGPGTKSVSGRIRTFDQTFQAERVKTRRRLSESAAFDKQLPIQFARHGTEFGKQRRGSLYWNDIGFDPRYGRPFIESATGFDQLKATSPSYVQQEAVYYPHLAYAYTAAPAFGLYVDNHTEVVITDYNPFHSSNHHKLHSMNMEIDLARAHIEQVGEDVPYKRSTNHVRDTAAPESEVSVKPTELHIAREPDRTGPIRSGDVPIGYSAKHAPQSAYEDPMSPTTISLVRYLFEYTPDVDLTVRAMFDGMSPEPEGEKRHLFEAKAPAASSFTVSSVVPKSAEFERSSNETYEDPDHSILTPDLLGYFPSADAARQAAIDDGVEEERIQTHELYPDCWVWAEVLDQPNLCEPTPPSVDAGWIKGG
tara:strand:+ start:11125 stop:15246 length:4122 start_codon:yes stop_codon:yes gene_type:complete